MESYQQDVLEVFCVVNPCRFSNLTFFKLNFLNGEIPLLQNKLILFFSNADTFSSFAAQTFGYTEVCLNAYLILLAHTRTYLWWTKKFSSIKLFVEYIYLGVYPRNSTTSYKLHSAFTITSNKVLLFFGFIIP